MNCRKTKENEYEKVPLPEVNGTAICPRRDMPAAIEQFKNPTCASKCCRGARARVQNSRSRSEGVFSYAESERTGRGKRILINEENRPGGRFSTLNSVQQCMEVEQSDKHLQIINVSIRFPVCADRGSPT